jgi:hypothetical protein
LALSSAGVATAGNAACANRTAVIDATVIIFLIRSPRSMIIPRVLEVAGVIAGRYSLAAVK